VTKVDFYILEEGSSQDRYRLACRVAEKAWQSGHRVLIHTASLEEARHVDALLWTFRDQSFVPHDLLGQADPALAPVLVSFGTDSGGEHDVLINLTPEVPAFFSSFERVIEPLDAAPGIREAGRERYRFYRDRGYPLTNLSIAQ